MPTLVILATPDIELAGVWEEQVPKGRVALKVSGGEFPGAGVSETGALLVLDSVMESAVPRGWERCTIIFVGEPRSHPFEQARSAKNVKLCLSYADSRTRLHEFLPILEELAEKQSLLELISSKGRRSDTTRPSTRNQSPESAELWDFIEGAIEGIDTRDRLIGEFRRASRHLLRASHAVFFLREADGFRADRGTSYFPTEDPLVNFFESHPTIIDGSHWDIATDPVAELAVRNRMALWGARLLVPVHDNARLLGLIALGVRDDGQAYDEIDRGRAVQFARLLRNLLNKAVQLGRLSYLANQVALGARYLPGTLVLGCDEPVPRHVPLIVRDLIGQVRRCRQISRASPCTGQPFRASAGLVAETGGVWAFWEEASGEVHDAQARERAGRRELLRELALTLSHEVGNSLVSLTTFRQAQPGRPLPNPLIETVKRDIAQLEFLNTNLALMQRLHEVEAEAVDVREIAQGVGKALSIRVEVGPAPIVLSANRQLLDFALSALVSTLSENRTAHGAGELGMKVRSTGAGSDITALVSLNGRSLELEGILPEPVPGGVPNQGRIVVFLAKEILRLHHGDIHAGPGLEGTEILVSFRSW
jgi:hypothetical protein